MRQMHGGGEKALQWGEGAGTYHVKWLGRQHLQSTGAHFDAIFHPKLGDCALQKRHAFGAGLGQYDPTFAHQTHHQARKSGAGTKVNPPTLRRSEIEQLGRVRDMA